MNSGSPDVVVVGGGIAGSAISVVLAREGLSVLLLEKTLLHKDVTRGEWLAPWGVVEANKLGLTDLYLAEGGHRIDQHISYSDLESAEASEAAGFNIAEMGIEKPLCIRHPVACDLLNREAVALGVNYVRGIQAIQVTPGSPPSVEYKVDGQAATVTPRWVIGADGRNGVVASQLGCKLTKDPEHHLFSGMLVEDAHDWPVGLQVIATEGDAHVLAFPQGDGRIRIYLGWPSDDRGRLVGLEGSKRFLDSWQLSCVPHAEAIANATPASPCIAYPNADAWVDQWVHEGVVLIGDAAGRNDPITGQGLSITHRDVRLASEAFLGNSEWSSGMFDEYVAERKERMSRLRTVARLTSLRDAGFGEAVYRQRAEIHQRLAAKPELMTPFMAAFAGPDAVPANCFEDQFLDAIVGEPIWGPNLA